ncbi:MAG: DUF58 domain-containing protein [Verrucomicrobia bacterium]|nr:DUF58 domain-containing protein [Verrucomicrobiota bacterium]
MPSTDKQTDSIAPGDLTGAAFIRRLESLFLLVRKVLGGSMQADRKSTRKGTGITFADYAEYRHGDDYRAIDWRVYARFDELVVKLFELEEDATVYILLDLSHSMAAKTGIARRLAAAPGYIGLNCQDRVAAYGMADELRPLLDPSRGRAHVLPFLRSLESAAGFGRDTDFSGCIRTLQARRGKKGLVVVISDFFFPTGFEEGLKRLAGLGHDIHALQVLGADDLTCLQQGDVELECVESGARKRVTITARESDAYTKAVTDWNERLRTECARGGIGFTRTMADDAFDEVIRTILQKGGLAS